MAVTLYDAFVPTIRQMLGSMQGVLQKAQLWCAETGMSDATLAGLRMHRTMLPMSFQIRSVAHHSLGAIDAMRSGGFDVQGGETPEDLASMQALVQRAAKVLAEVTSEELDAAQSRDVVVRLPSAQIPFTATDFLLSFSQPNFFFHATTAYDLLREAGVELGKRDFLGQLRIKA